MEVAELAPRREVVASWDPDAVRIDATWIGDGASVLDSRAAAIDRSRVDLREAWQGAAGDAAVNASDGILLQRNVGRLSFGCWSAL
ncbi:hypothetical protein HQ305_16570 [Rhodococcus sp. BP-149]|uniref:hypothetical protein n=1 Tax=unclassified Rhodococcus (in: high G+C Gram-positive bacteria) TaxID=192944 RepID=UPI001C9B31D2|nr:MULTISPECIES: hypothetical protein [unclassified Rhodococcus (in: high G+C Gram-positive bacteria)]MBY6687174.1 hypothetical protein [Rhodococcus sp. BP-288]MBY6694403.1 hypothetical protein [Rhodococcus sp. BP-188]MBY6698112.1 hypothetical protein [Rhodococcus sp. BP-285]MBY6704332.1 hypothetical protein [Rhodococcus sp. BP-283]MBY6712981.1 hypothetical protein [Rhodococcus sp. BP-160]